MKPHKANTIIDIIAPAGNIRLPAGIEAIEAVLESWGYQARFGKNIFGAHPFLSNSLELRFEDLKNAMCAPDSNIVWIYRGGSGSAELLPLLDTIFPPDKQKIFLGFSDITSLHIYFNQQWGWPTYHGPGAKQIFNDQIDYNSLLSIQQLFQHQLSSSLQVQAVNKYSKKLSEFSGVITGGNLSVIIHSLGTPYQIQAENKILLLEDVNEPAYKIRRMLTHLRQANIFNNLSALILGEFIQADVTQKQWIEDELQAFADQQDFPVFRTNFISHGKTNYTIPLGKQYKLITVI